MSSGIITLLALLGFLSVVVWVYIIKRGSDFDAQARQPLEDDIEERRHLDRRYETHSSSNEQSHEESQQ